MQPTVSILIPAYNEEARIGRCVDSMLRQTYGNLEIVIVDDGSTDKTPLVLSGIKDSRVKVFRQPRSGRVTARNKALELASGPYIALQDADDWSEPARIERQLSMAQSVTGQPVIGTSLFLHRPGQPVRTIHYPDSDSVIRQKMSRPLFSGALFPPVMLARRDHLVRTGGWRDKFDVAAEDGDLLNRLFEDSDSHFHNLDIPLYHYELSSKSITANLSRTVPYQMFKRHCTRERRHHRPEPESFSAYLSLQKRNPLTALRFEIEYLAWHLYMMLVFR